MAIKVIPKNKKEFRMIKMILKAIEVDFSIDENELIKKKDSAKSKKK